MKKQTINNELEQPTNENVAIIEPDSLSEHDHKKLDKDMKYRAPLSYRSLRLIGWIAMALMFVGMMLSVALSIRTSTGSLTPGQAAGFERASSILSYASALPLPLFLIANFAVILQQKNNYKKLIIRYAKLVLIVYVAFIFVYYHYIVIFLMRLGDMSFPKARYTSIQIFTLLGKQSGLVVNTFVDLFCCVLIMFFIDYTPKKRFQGKKIILFRLLVLIPILYEIGSAVLMGLTGMSATLTTFTFSLPPEILPLVGKKPIGMIFGFVAICVFIKIREKLYIKKGGTPEGYELYHKTNRNSFMLSLMMAITFAIIVILDAVALIVPSIVAYKNNPDLGYLENFITILSSFTVGKSVCLIFVIPFTFLFSYTKQHENPKFDKLLPLIGVGLVVFSIIETLFFALLF